MEGRPLYLPITLALSLGACQDERSFYHQVKYFLSSDPVSS